MVFSLTWLPEVLEAEGLKVSEVEGWRTRGRAEMSRVRGVICHHTATAGHADKNMPTLNMLIHGRPDLHGPLAQLGLGRDGTFYVIAAGRANHAGVGRWEGITTGNSSFIGIEAEHSGRPEDPWPPAQMEAYQRGVAALLRRIGARANMCCGHKEYALPANRKPDPTFDMAVFRNAVTDLLQGKTPPPPIPAKDDAQRPTIRRGARGEWVTTLQRLIGGIDVDGTFGGATEAALRAFQRTAAVQPPLVPDGIAGPKTWTALEARGPAGNGGPAHDATGTPPRPSESQSGQSPEELFREKAPGIMRKLIDEFGFTEVQAAGILGNIGHECVGFTQMQEIHPLGGGRGGFGWCQWTGARRRNFEGFCRDSNLEPTSDEGNYGFLAHELKTTEGRALRALKASATIEAAVHAFLERFERAGIAHEDSRLRWAGRALEAFHG